MQSNRKKAKKPYVSKFSELDVSSEIFEPERYEELIDEGFSDSFIANELKVDEGYVSGLAKDIQKKTIDDEE